MLILHDSVVVCIIMRIMEIGMPQYETLTRKILARLVAEGWVSDGGAKHDKFQNPSHPGVKIIIPRHREQSLGVAKSIAQAAGWE